MVSTIVNKKTGQIRMISPVFKRKGNEPIQNKKDMNNFEYDNIV